jgi:hypothetical protein
MRGDTFGLLCRSIFARNFAPAIFPCGDVFPPAFPVIMRPRLIDLLAPPVMVFPIVDPLALVPFAAPPDALGTTFSFSPKVVATAIAPIAGYPPEFQCRQFDLLLPPLRLRRV